MIERATGHREQSTGYPRVRLNESAMREGMQIESVNISTQDKLQLLDALTRTGIEQIEVGSFVSPRWTPQMSDIDQLVTQVTPVEGTRLTAIALNDKGRERRSRWMPPLEHDLLPPLLAAHLCATFLRRNVNRNREEEFAAWPTIVEAAVERGTEEAAIGVAAAWGSNFEGKFSLDQRMEVLESAHDAWTRAGVPVTWVWFADPMSWCLPHEVEQQLDAVLTRWPHIRNVHLHLHDARGMALPSIYAALRALDESFTLQLDVSAGGIGGCPYCGNGRATGMAPTEDVVHMLDGMGIPTGVDLDNLIDAVHLLDRILGRSTMGHVSKAGPRPDGNALYDPNLPFVETHEQALHFCDGPSVAAGGLSPWTEPIPDARPGARNSSGSDDGT
ncbi:hypothetical protein CH298_26675 [Rhodococcoides fascians]|uniref:hypothetical protein n=1 Tax=Rhodococcoides fascians TaxID=1828 RepID=UPI000B9C729D|nr:MULTISPECIES: hypothetical protein [Rhodococcus]OZD68962.1 hypothetical protein CH263_08740 [Rhodococcus sp. 06-1059B-a]OZE81356.1 hypothetical protein CH303_27215 [Rhodococcus fascians]OZF10180.1 hypothetical protein CH298_26675 [Rhodococcus fascians]OZF13271.1 hypothetical protein CH297_26970 [Rhodococcus fascians]OZF59368.1 hypothetical protein CH308_27415 [Rhodococcus fascians]